MNFNNILKLTTLYNEYDEEIKNDIFVSNNNMSGGKMKKTSSSSSIMTPKNVKKISRKKNSKKDSKKDNQKKNDKTNKNDKKMSRNSKKLKRTSSNKRSNSYSSSNSFTDDDKKSSKMKRSLPEALKKYQELIKFIVEKMSVPRIPKIISPFVSIYKTQAAKITDDKIKQMDEAKKLFLIDFNKGLAREKYDKIAAEKANTKKSSKKNK